MGHYQSVRCADVSEEAQKLLLHGSLHSLVGASEVRNVPACAMSPIVQHLPCVHV